MCQFTQPLAIGDVEAVDPAPGSPVGGSLRLDFGNTVITASTAITVDSTSIIYTGYTNSSGNYVGVVRINLGMLKIMYDSFHLFSSTSSSTHFHLKFTWPRKSILHAQYDISCETAAVEE